MVYKVVVPANTTATLIMPIDEGYALYEGGKPVGLVPGIDYHGIPICTVSGMYVGQDTHALSQGVYVQHGEKSVK